MKQRQLLQVLLLTSSVWVLTTNPALGKKVQHSSLSNNTNAINHQQVFWWSFAQSVAPTREIRRNSQVERMVNNATRRLVQSPTPSSPSTNQVIEVTYVKANAITGGVEIILETPSAEQLQVSDQTEGNSFIADIPNAQLRLPNGNGFTFRSEKPTAGIIEITVANFDANTIQVTVTGEADVPIVELFDSDEGLIFSLTPAASSTETQEEPPKEPETPETVQPESETQQEETVQPDDQTPAQVEPGSETQSDELRLRKRKLKLW